MPLAGQKRDLKIVPLKGFTPTYAFRTTIDGASATALGHASGVDAQGKLVAGAVLGASSPKPPRASKRTEAKGNESSFLNYNNVAALRADGWTITSGSIAVPSATDLATPVFVEITNGAVTIRYGWLISKAQLALIGGDAANLGIELVTENNYDTVIFGVNNPKPKRAKKELATGGRITTFVSTAAEDSLPAGWSLGGGKRLQFGL